MRFSFADAKPTDHSFATGKLIEVNPFRCQVRKRATEVGIKGRNQQQDGPIGSHACDEAAAFADASGFFEPLTPCRESSGSPETP